MREKEEARIIEAGGDAPTADVVSFPASVQERLARAQELLRHGGAGGTADALQGAAAELARANPEMLAVLMAGQLGHGRIAQDEEEIDTVTVGTGRYVLGIRFKRDETVTTNRKGVKRTIRLE